MIKKRKSVFCVMLTIAIVLTISVNVFAAEESFTITGSSTVGVAVPGSPVFDSTTHIGNITAGSDIVFNGSNDNICITDETGTNSGWKFSIAVTDFYAQGVDDPTDSGSADMEIFIASGEWLSLSLDNSFEGIVTDIDQTLIAGPTGNGGIVDAGEVLFFGTPLPLTTPNYSVAAVDTINIVTVNPGFGAGKYSFDLNYTICINEWIPVGSKITSSSLSEERFDDILVESGDLIQVFAGTYSTNITYSASCNPAS